MTAQEIYEREGFLIASYFIPFHVGQVFENTIPGILERGVKLVVLALASQEEAESYHRRTGTRPPFSDHVHFAKVIAE